MLSLVCHQRPMAQSTMANILDTISAAENGDAIKLSVPLPRRLSGTICSLEAASGVMAITAGPTEACHTSTLKRKYALALIENRRRDGTYGTDITAIFREIAR